MRERLKRRIRAGSKGGAAGQWSARKAQLLAQEYAKHGGRYRGGRSPTQRSLQRWTKQDWTTADGRPAKRAGTTARYLPRGAWARLSPTERRATDAKKRAGAAHGRRKVANTEHARAASSAARSQRAAGGSGARRRAPARKHARRGTRER